MANPIKRLFNLLKCAALGHVEFKTAPDNMPRIFQPKSEGNAYRDLKACSRCDGLYCVRGILNAAELAEEAEHERKNAALIQQLQAQNEEMIDRILASQVLHDKTALN